LYGRFAKRAYGRGGNVTCPSEQGSHRGLPLQLRMAGL